MNKAYVVMLGLCVIVAAAGCQSSPNRAPEGAVLGGAIGAGLGAIIGHQSGETGEGAALGAALGAGAGALAGSQMQKDQPAPQSQQSANPNQMSVIQVVQLSQQGVHEDVIVDRIRMSGSRFTLSPSDVEYLQKQGVSQKVIAAMQGY
jgi:uncharacterized protein HemX